MTIGQYSILRTLTPDRSFLATDGTGREVVIKMLDADCLLRGRLHPNIHSRLARVRELAHTGVANLHGVERDGGGVFAVWQYIPGATLDEYAARFASPAALGQFARELVMSVESLHALGIVHGRIHGGNVIIDDSGGTHLTHVSPLLYDDPAGDARDVAKLIGAIAARRGWDESPLALMVRESPALAQMRRWLSPGAEAQASTPERHPPGGARWRAYAAAAVTTVLAAILAAILVRSARHGSPRAPTPPQAPPAAFRARGGPPGK